MSKSAPHTLQKERSTTQPFCASATERLNLSNQENLLGIVYTLSEAARYLRLDEQTVAALAAAGEIQHSMSAGKLRFTSDQLDRYEINQRLKERRREEHPSVIKRTLKRGPENLHPWTFQNA